MIISISDQLWVFFVMTLTGAILGLCYDFLRLFRRIWSHKNLSITLQDFIFWAAAGAVVFYMLILTDLGRLRGFSILGAILGAVLYFLILSLPFLKLTTRVALGLKRRSIKVLRGIKKKIPIRKAPEKGALD